MRDHIYKDHAHVIDVLTNQYGFEYTGIGDNGEECFHKQVGLSEAIYVHPMFCSYRMDSSNNISNNPWQNKPHDVSFKSIYEIESTHKAAFKRLCAYLDDYTVPVPNQWKIENTLKSIEARRQELVDMALDPNVNVDVKKQIPEIYEKVIEFQTTLTHIMAHLK